MRMETVFGILERVFHSRKYMETEGKLIEMQRSQ